MHHWTSMCEGSHSVLPSAAKACSASCAPEFQTSHSYCQSRRSTGPAREYRLSIAAATGYLLHQETTCAVSRRCHDKECFLMGCKLNNVRKLNVLCRRLNNLTPHELRSAVTLVSNYRKRRFERRLFTSLSLGFDRELV